mmetsp:Transcript_39062/g.91380  ORF Transcript_39062/g.91380 Transcript_39062/m.91380 type:complete len:168 (-) Transcript_39062:249-752(-)
MGKQVKRGGRSKFSAPEDLDREAQAHREVGNQRPNAGQMPSSSDDEDDAPRKVKGGQNPNVGMLPPNSSDEDEEDEDEDKAPVPKAVELTRNEREQLEAQKAAEPDPEQVRKDMERLQMIKKKREEQAANRIEKEGWDRMKPMSEENHPPGMQWPPVQSSDNKDKAN